MKRRLALSIVLLLSILSGCKQRASGDDKKAPTAPVGSVSGRLGTVDAASSSTAKAGERRPEVATALLPSSPDQVVVAAGKAFSKGGLSTIYAMLPHSYQSEVQALYKKSVMRIDAKTWRRVWNIAERLLSALQKNKESIVKASQHRDDLFVAQELLVLCMDAGLNDAEVLKELDIERFLADNGQKLLDLVTSRSPRLGLAGGETERFRKQMGTISAEVKKSGETSAVVNITIGHTTEEQDWVKVEGRWVPKALANAWPEFMRKGHRIVDKALTTIGSRQDELEEALDRVDAAMDDFEKRGDIDGLTTALGAAWALTQNTSPLVRIPPWSSPLVDAANVISQTDEELINLFLLELKKQTATQIAVLTMPDTGDEDIGAFTMRVFTEWGVGSKSDIKGVVVVVSLNQRQYFTGTGEGAQDALPDVLLATLSRQILVPAFRRGDHGLGLRTYLYQLAHRFDGTEENGRKFAALLAVEDTLTDAPE